MQKSLRARFLIVFFLLDDAEDVEFVSVHPLGRHPRVSPQGAPRAPSTPERVVDSVEDLSSRPVKRRCRNPGRRRYVPVSEAWFNRVLHTHTRVRHPGPVPSVKGPRRTRTTSGMVDEESGGSFRSVGQKEDRSGDEDKRRQGQGKR